MRRTLSRKIVYVIQHNRNGVCYLSVPLQLLVLKWLIEGGFVPAVEPGAVLQAPSNGPSPELAKVTLVGNFNLLLKSFL